MYLEKKVLLPFEDIPFVSFVTCKSNMTTQIEKQYVLNTYNQIANEFSHTRYNVWNFVNEFLEHKKELFGLDMGCGNGKNMIHDNMIGIDTNETFVEICKSKGKSVISADICELPFREGLFDYCFSVSVIHHLSTEERRVRSIDELIRVLKPCGYGMFNVWSYEQQEKRSFVRGDNYVEWRSNKKSTLSSLSSLRYYYIMDYEMFSNLIDKFSDKINILHIKNEKGNWIVTFTKK